MAIKKKVIGGSSKNNNSDLNKKTSSNQNSFWSEVSKHLMTGISYMIPVLIMGGLLGALSQLIPYVILNINPDVGIVEAMNNGDYHGLDLSLLQLSELLSTFGFTLFGFAIPIFAAFTASSIGGKTALIAGFIGGYVSVNPIDRLSEVDGLWTPTEPVASGFLGAIVIAFGIGYLVKYLNEKINLPHSWLAFKTTFLIPIIAGIITMIAMYYIVTPVGGLLNKGIQQLLEKAGDAGEIVYALVLSAATAFDLGGPVNKAAGFVAYGFTVEEILPVTARNLAIVIPSIGLGLATIIDKFLVGKRVYERQFHEAGKTSVFLAFMGISEGAIPFALENPAFVIPINMVGAMLGGTVAVLLGAVQWFPESAIWAWPLIENFIAYVAGLLIGSVFIAVSNVYYRNYLIKKGKLNVI